MTSVCRMERRGEGGRSVQGLRAQAGVPLLSSAAACPWNNGGERRCSSTADIRKRGKRREHNLAAANVGTCMYGSAVVGVAPCPFSSSLGPLLPHEPACRSSFPICPIIGPRESWTLGPPRLCVSRPGLVVDLGVNPYLEGSSCLLGWLGCACRLAGRGGIR
jgi:hypothetical protein